MNTPTPRTDDQIGYAGSTMTMVRIDFARQLERELAEAKEKLSNYSDAFAVLENKNVGLEKDRDEWKAIAEGLMNGIIETAARFNAKKGQQ